VAGKDNTQPVPAENVYALNATTESLMQPDSHATRWSVPNADRLWQEPRRLTVFQPTRDPNQEPHSDPEHSEDNRSETIRSWDVQNENLYAPPAHTLFQKQRFKPVRPEPNLPI